MIGRRIRRALLAVVVGAAGVIGPATAASAVVVDPKLPAVGAADVAVPAAGQQAVPVIGAKLVLLTQRRVVMGPSGRASVHADVVNTGRVVERDRAFIAVALAPGFFIDNRLPGNCVAGPLGHVAICTFQGLLLPGRADSVTIPIRTGLRPRPTVSTIVVSGGTYRLPAEGSPARVPLVVF